MSYRMRNILIAVGLAGLAALLTTYYVSNYKKSVQHGQAATAVVVAAKPIPQGMLGADVISKGYLKTQQVPRDAVVPGAISSPGQIRSLVATEPTYVGEQVSSARFGPLVQQGIKGQLTGTYRAMQLAGDPNQVLAGTIEPGDHVDFVGVVTLQGTNSSDVTYGRVVVRDLKVLETQTPGGTSRISGSTNSTSAVMLRMTDAQAQKVALVYKKGDYWTLTERPGLKAADSPNSVETGWTLLHDGIDPSKLASIFGGK